MNLSRARFDNAIVRRAIFKGTDLSYATFTDADLTDADFTDSDLTGAKVSGAKFSGIEQVINAKGLTPVSVLGARNTPPPRSTPHSEKR